MSTLSDGITEFAKMLKERENIITEIIVIGKVLSVSPLKVADGTEIQADEGDDLIVTNTIDRLRQSNELHVGDNLLLIADNQIYAAIDKVVS